MSIAVELEGLLREYGGSREVIDRGRGWVELRSLKLRDAEGGRPLTEWFHVFACNRYYFDNRVSVAFPGRGGAFLVQEEFNEVELRDFAFEKFSRVHVDSWADVNDAMGREFIHQDFEFRGSLAPDAPRRRRRRGAGWVEWRALNLLDTLRGRGVAEEFWVAACDEHYCEQSVAKEFPDKRGAFLVQAEFGEVELEDFARRKFMKLSFMNFDDFFRKMSAEFIWEDEDERRWW